MLPELLASYISGTGREKEKLLDICSVHIFTCGQLLELNEAGAIGVYALKSLFPLVDVIEKVAELGHADCAASVLVEHV